MFICSSCVYKQREVLLHLFSKKLEKGGGGILPLCLRSKSYTYRYVYIQIHKFATCYLQLFCILY